MAENTFLKEVAIDLYDKFGRNGLSQITIVAPSKRTRLFMNKYFAELSAGEPFTPPKYLTVVQLCGETGSLQLYNEESQRITLVWELYQAYKAVRESKQIPDNESFDDFYYFGEVLLHDFDDIDKNLASAEQIYVNIADLKRLDSWSFLNDEQKDVIRRFLNYDIEEKTQLQHTFFDIWHSLSEVYQRFKTAIKAKNFAYEGMMMREVVENLQHIDFPASKYAFVGFNYLSGAELKLLEHLKDRALYYWDYDLYYLETEAGKFLKNNLQRFPDELKSHEHNHFGKPKKIVFLEADNPVSQTGYASEWLKSIDNQHNNFADADTAIVLCDVRILPPLLSQLPAGVNPNIAILYSLMQSRIAGFLIQLAELQVKGIKNNAFDLNFLLPVLKNPFAALLYPAVSQDLDNILKTKRLIVFPDSVLTIIEEGKDVVEAKVLTDRTLFGICQSPHEIVGYLRNIIELIAENQAIEDELETAAILEARRMLSSLDAIVPYLSRRESVLKLLKRLLVSVKISYSGEPAKGLQIMAMSDTRTMDFKNLMALSVNDGVFPAIEPESSFIPPLLRKAFGLPSLEDQDAQEAYGFYRLLQRSENVALAYSVAKNGTGKGEKSRYLMQLLWESPHKDAVQCSVLRSPLPEITDKQALRVEKTDGMLSLLREKYNGATLPGGKKKALSPSAFNNYIDCPLQFCFRYVTGLKTPDDLDTSLDNAYLGSIFHKTMEKIYSGYKEISADFFNKYIDNKGITFVTEKLLEEAFVEEYFNTPVERKDYNGEQNIYFQVIARMVENTLKYDRRYAPFEILGLEEAHYFDIEGICVGGIIDRIDKKDGLIRVVDYKTGKTPVANSYASELADIFKEGRKQKAGYQFQTFLYSSILSKQTGAPVAPALIFPLAADDDDYSPALYLQNEEITDFRLYAEDFSTHLSAKLKELFSKSTPFTQPEKDAPCKYCDYRSLCNR